MVEELVWRWFGGGLVLGFDGLVAWWILLVDDCLVDWFGGWWFGVGGLVVGGLVVGGLAVWF